MIKSEKLISDTEEIIPLRKEWLVSCCAQVPATTEYTKHATLKAHSDQTESQMRRISRALRVLPLRAFGWILYVGGKYDLPL